ncbi:hypothetical protein DPMN_175029 [Dreissena polymorpha]|uniref:Uncharacterized protein n=1 Tax=Dreissena polymorpha TaxID=45954 RepID=A0A9D4IFN5_DREPO|nr:hypothetical protein DPMN_175029 [Dreissena polymorpha]
MRVNIKAGSRCFAQKSRSEGDLCRPEAWKSLDCNYSESLDSGLNTFSSIQCKSYTSQDWKRRPYMTQSTSEKDVQIDGNKSNHARLPRYRVTINEFLSNVNQENLASYLQFYDRVTRKANIERLGRNGSVYV